MDAVAPSRDSISSVLTGGLSGAADRAVLDDDGRRGAAILPPPLLGGAQDSTATTAAPVSTRTGTEHFMVYVFLTGAWGLTSLLACLLG